MAVDSSAKPAKKIVLVVGLPDYETAFRVTEGHRKRGKKYRYAYIYNGQVPAEEKTVADLFDIAISCDLASDEAIVAALGPYKEELIAITVPRFEKYIPWLQRMIPFVPQLHTPTVESLTWATNKIEMRKHFVAYNPRVSPKFLVVENASNRTIKTIQQEIGLPVVIKPSGLAASLLVSIAFHAEELEQSLKRIFRKIRVQWRQVEGRGEPQVLVEQFMDGTMYSLDAYVVASGKIYFCPLVYVKTGREIGFDDFFGYERLTPTDLSKESTQQAREVSADAIRALALLNTTCHVELMKTEQGWKVIELGPRAGGFRDFMYRFSYGIDHYANDIAIRAGKQPKIPRKLQNHVAVFEIFAKQEGLISNITGSKKIRELQSFHHIENNKKIGDKALYAKHGGSSILNLFLFNKDRSELLADIRRMEQMLKIETEPRAQKKEKP